MYLYAAPVEPLYFLHNPRREEGTPHSHLWLLECLRPWVHFLGVHSAGSHKLLRWGALAAVVSHLIS